MIYFHPTRNGLQCVIIKRARFIDTGAHMCGEFEWGMYEYY